MDAPNPCLTPLKRPLLGAVVLALAGVAPSMAHAEWVAVNEEGCKAEILFPRPPETTTWTGGCANGKIDGEGVLASSNGTRLQGRFRQGAPVDVKGRISALREDGRRVAVGATFVAGKGEFHRWQKPADQLARYAQTLGSLIRSRIILPEPVEGNPAAVVELRTRADGRVASFKMVNPSGVAAWDAAVLRALQQTESLPFDEDGTLPELLELTFRPQ